MAKQTVVPPEANPVVRAETVRVSKLASLKSSRPVTVACGRETFVFETGKLTEYEYVLPPEYLEYRDLNYGGDYR
ncbi:MAG: hypothetical protein WCI01_11750 [Chlorobiaceae bacterium]